MTLAGQARQPPDRLPPDHLTACKTTGRAPMRSSRPTAAAPARRRRGRGATPAEARARHVLPAVRSEPWERPRRYWLQAPTALAEGDDEPLRIPIVRRRATAQEWNGSWP